MNIEHTNPSTWLERGTVLLASGALLGGLASADPTGSGNESPASISPEATAPAALQVEQEPTSGYGKFKKALQDGRFWVNLNYRYEGVDQDPDPGTGLPSKKAGASTLRTRLGYESATWNDWSGLLEFNDVNTIGGSSYNDLLNGKTQYPVVADAPNTVVNQVYAKYGGFWESDIKVGRQRIKYDNDRFIGNVGWRQTEQVFDSVSWVKPDLASMTLAYAYIDHIDRIFGGESPLGNLDSNSHILNLSKSWDNVGKLVGYGYYIDAPDLTSINSFTYGLRFDGGREFDKFGLLYTAEIAQQQDVADNPNAVDAGYLHAVFGGQVKGFTAKLGYEVLEGSDNADGQFQTPLATLHAFNGWADKFLSTPQGGIEDAYIMGGWKAGKGNLVAIYHDFSAEQGNVGDYGTELDLQYVYKFSFDVDLGLKYAEYSAKNFATDTTKFWVWLYYSF